MKKFNTDDTTVGRDGKSCSPRPREDNERTGGKAPDQVVAEAESVRASVISTVAAAGNDERSRDRLALTEGPQQRPRAPSPTRERSQMTSSSFTARPWKRAKRKDEQQSRSRFGSIVTEAIGGHAAAAAAAAAHPRQQQQHKLQKQQQQSMLQEQPLGLAVATANDAGRMSPFVQEDDSGNDRKPAAVGIKGDPLLNVAEFLFVQEDDSGSDRKPAKRRHHHHQCDDSDDDHNDDDDDDDWAAAAAAAAADAAPVDTLDEDNNNNDDSDSDSDADWHKITAASSSRESDSVAAATAAAAAAASVLADTDGDDEQSRPCRRRMESARSRSEDDKDDLFADSDSDDLFADSDSDDLSPLSLSSHSDRNSGGGGDHDERLLPVGAVIRYRYCEDDDWRAGTIVKRDGITGYHVKPIWSPEMDCDYGDFVKHSNSFLQRLSEIELEDLIFSQLDRLFAGRHLEVTFDEFPYDRYGFTIKSGEGSERLLNCCYYFDYSSTDRITSKTGDGSKRLGKYRFTDAMLTRVGASLRRHCRDLKHCRVEGFFCQQFSQDA